MSRIIFSIMFMFKFIMPRHAELSFFNFCVGKREETIFEIFFRYLNECVLFIGSYQKDLYFLKKMIVLSMIGITTIIVLLIQAIREMHRKQINNRPAKGCSNTNQDSLLAKVNINHHMRVKSLI